MEFNSREEGFNVKKTALSWGVVEKVCMFVSVFGRRKMLHCQRWRWGGGGGGVSESGMIILKGDSDACFHHDTGLFPSF